MGVARPGEMFVGYCFQLAMRFRWRFGKDEVRAGVRMPRRSLGAKTDHGQHKRVQSRQKEVQDFAPKAKSISAGTPQNLHSRHCNLFYIFCQWCFGQHNGEIE
ncbi:MAG: hypothetical protein R3A44_16055 [Caldilineaceae bacterium]